MTTPVLLEEEDQAPRKARRTRRLERHLKRGGNEELNIVSMIDVFAVLVFFLLVNQIGVSVLGIELPGPPVASTSGSCSSMVLM